MKYRQEIITAMMLLAALTACSSSDELADTDEKVSARLAFSLSKAADDVTRQSGSVAQVSGFRGIELVRLIPFGTRGKITAADMPKYFDGGTMGDDYDKPNGHFFLTQGCTLQSGTASFLFYGRALRASGASDASNGALEANVEAIVTPADITFSPKQMVATTDVPEGAQQVAAYLTAIANARTTIAGNTVYWRNSSHSVLKALFLNFTHQDDYGNSALVPGSSANAVKYAASLQTALDGIDFSGDATAAAIKTAILAAIADRSMLPEDEYPASLGLPEGAATLLWRPGGAVFVPQTETTTIAGINNITRFCYPAELYYYVNSQIRTSTDEVAAANYESASTWATVLGHYEYDNGVVSNNTKAVAIIEPAQYAVASMQVKLKQVASTLKDSRGNDIAVGATAFPLTGIIVGGQHAVGYDFTPIDTPDRIVYDSQVQTDGTRYLSTTVAESAAVHTLLLQSNEDDTAVPVILEFRNDSGSDFYGIGGGIVYQGTKFYLVASVKRPAQTAGIEDYKKRVFTQDYTTTFSMQVLSLAQAYNVLPNILSARLEVGVQVVSDWVQASTTVVPL